MAQQYRNNIVKLANELVGTSKPYNDAYFVELYKKWYTKSHPNVSTPWSTFFLTYLARIAGIPVGVFPNISTVSALINWANIRGLFTDAADVAADKVKPGQIVIFSDMPDHCGLVIDRRSDKIVFVEELNFDTYEVAKRNRNLKSGFISGYIDINYETKETDNLYDPTSLPTLIKPYRIQQFRDWITNTYGIDLVESFVQGTPKGSFTKGWYRVATAALQIELGLAKVDPETYPDGDFDSTCRTAVDHKPIRINSRGNKATIIQGLLYTWGYDCKGMSDRFDTHTKDALKSFQESKSLEGTGIIDSETMRVLLKQ